MNKYKKRIKILNFMRDIQGEDGNYNYDSYMLGLYNGVELASSIMEDREPNFRSGKDIKFLHEKTSKCIEIPNDDFEDIKPLILKTFGRTGEAITIDRFEDYTFDNFKLIEDTLCKVILNQKKIINILKSK